MHFLALIIFCLGCFVVIKILNRKGTKTKPPVVSKPGEIVGSYVRPTYQLSDDEENKKHDQAIKDIIQLLEKKVTENNDLTVTIEKTINMEMRYKVALLSILKQYGWNEDQVNNLLALIEYD